MTLSSACFPNNEAQVARPDLEPDAVLKAQWLEALRAIVATEPRGSAAWKLAYLVLQPFEEPEPDADD